jgi:hypothetical protein
MAWDARTRASSAPYGGVSAQIALMIDGDGNVDAVGLSRAESPCAGELPASLTVPAGNQLAFALAAEGVQIYSCARSGASYGWEFRAPQARLFEARGREAGMHYAGPTWESGDGSRLVGAKVAAVTPDAAAIPWLLLRAASHAGSGRMQSVTFVQRMKTWGGGTRRAMDATLPMQRRSPACRTEPSTASTRRARGPRADRPRAPRHLRCKEPHTVLMSEFRDSPRPGMPERRRPDLPRRRGEPRPKVARRDHSGGASTRATTPSS